MANYEKLIFNTDIDYTPPEVGKILIAQPFLDETHFRHAVILLVDRDKRGCFTGFVMNKPTGSFLNEALDNVKFTGRSPEFYLGGPVGTDHIFFLHDLGDYVSNSKEVFPGLFFGGNFDQMIDYVNSTPDFDRHVRFFVGYSGWEHQQLEQEIEDNTWAVGNAGTPELIFEKGADSYWHSNVRRLGDKYRSWLYHPMNTTAN